MLKTRLKCVLAVAAMSVATLTYAEDAAPVYDADNYPPQFDGQGDAGMIEGPQGTAGSISSQSMSLNQRISRAEQQITNLQHKDLTAKFETLQSEQQSLRGQVEQLSHQAQAQKGQPGLKTDASKSELQALRAQVEQLTQQVRELQGKQGVIKASASKKEVLDPSVNDEAISPDDAPLNDVANDASTKSTVKASTVTTQNAKSTKTSLAAVAADADKSASQPNVAEEQQIYQTAYDLIKAKKYNEAIASLQKMLQKYPTGQFAANAHYWLGELYGLLGKNDQSAVEFSRVVTDFPGSPKVADAQLKLGLIYSAQFKWVDAKGAFKKVINHYPGTASSRLAAEQLKQIKEAGH
jgi:tol-pal system protein YbgF